MEVSTRPGRKRTLSPKQELKVTAIAHMVPENGLDSHTVSSLHEEACRIKRISRSTAWRIVQRNKDLISPFEDPSDILNRLEDEGI